MSIFPHIDGERDKQVSPTVNGRSGEKGGTARRMLDAATFEPGFKIDERVELIELVGKGAMGAVYRARQLNVDRPVAVKTLHLSALTDKDSVARFFREAKLVSSLDHPNIVKIYSFGTVGDQQPYMVMDFVEGVTLADLIAQKKLKANDYIDIFLQVASALGHAHKQGIVHRDIKPRNILIQTGVDKKYAVKLADFGIARLAIPDAIPDQKITKTGAIIGSPAYMSPEQCTGRAVDQRTDIYSLGCVMYEAATGFTPFRDDDAVGLIGKHVMQNPRPIDGITIVPGLPKAISRVIGVAMNKQPEDRYQDVDLLACDLMAIRDGKAPPIADKIPIVVPAVPKEKKKINKKVIAGFVAASVLLAGGFLLFRAFGVGEAPPPPTANSAFREINDMYTRARWLSEKKDYLNALTVYSDAFLACKRAGLQDRLFADICVGRARCEMNLHNYSSACRYFPIAMNYYGLFNSNNVEEIGAIKEDWGRCLLKLEDYGEAARLLLSSFGTYKTLKLDGPHKVSLMRDLIDALEGAQKYYTAAGLYPEYIEAQKAAAIIGAERAKTMNNYADVLELIGKKSDAAEQRKMAAQAKLEDKKEEDALIRGGS